MGDDEARSAPPVEELAEESAPCGIEVVARLVEDEPCGSGESRTGEADAHGLPTGEGPQPAVEVTGLETQPHLGEGGQGPLFDVPVVADDGEVLVLPVPGEGAVEGGADGSDAEDGLDGDIGVREQLVDVDGASGADDGARRRGEFAGEETGEGGLSDPVVTDEADASGRDGRGEGVEDLGVVAEAVAESGDGDGSSHL
ncbi:Uncharacterised protein [Mycobacteroides abscessus subsp. abscessus]|nr:Uncharacterised protein [Mycobacteroides abscessus subsp. abscessus]